MPDKTCLNCRNIFPAVRCLCRTCYAKFYKMVRGGKTTWAELEAAGKCRAADPPDKRNVMRHLKRTSFDDK